MHGNGTLLKRKKGPHHSSKVSELHFQILHFFDLHHQTLCRYGKRYKDIPILHKLAKHEETDCNVCLKEEAKSKTLKLNKTKIILKEFIQSNQCWNCNLIFECVDAQVQHFLDKHECQFCTGKYDHWYFEDPSLKMKHISEYHAICDYCGEVFHYNFQKEEHIEEKHNTDKVENAIASEQCNKQPTFD